MVLALITFLIMFQMFESWDRNKRATASGGGAMVSGALAMFRFERDVRLAGFGFGNSAELGCSVAAYYSSRPDEAASGAVSATASHLYSFPLVPMQIVDSATGPDQIAILYASAEGVSSTRYFGTASAGLQPFTSLTSTSATMDIGARSGIHQGDLVLIAQDATHCNLVEVTDASSGDRRTFNFAATGTYTHFYTEATGVSPRYNNPSGVTTVSQTGNVYVLGPLPQRRIWQISNGRTLGYVNDFWTDNVNNTSGVAGADGVNDVTFTDVADNVVSLKAQYGFMATVSGSTCTPSTTPTWTTTVSDPCLWPFLWAVRVALLARSDQFEKTWGVPAGDPAPQWAGGHFPMTNIDGTTDSYTSSTATNPSRNPNDWRHYRYKVFESTIPLKNVMWASR